jgi:hypothetical protein
MNREIRFVGLTTPRSGASRFPQKGEAVWIVVNCVETRNNECRPADTMSYQYATSYSTSKDEGRLTNMWQRLVRQSQYDAKGKPRTRLAIVRRRLLRLPTAIFALWFFVLLWGERRVFSSSIDACKWDQWEKWVCLAHAYRMLIHSYQILFLLLCQG